MVKSFSKKKKKNGQVGSPYITTGRWPIGIIVQHLLVTTKKGSKHVADLLAPGL